MGFPGKTIDELVLEENTDEEDNDASDDDDGGSLPVGGRIQFSFSHYFFL